MVAFRPHSRMNGNASSLVYGALDLGTNNCRLLVARPEAGGFKVIDSFSRVVRLGEGMEASGRLSEAAQDRALAALAICADKIRRDGVTMWRAVATEACRRAENCPSFLDRVRRQTGLEIEIISAREEAQLAMESCVPLLDPVQARALLFDIGGGSTEVMWLNPAGGRAPQVLGWISLPWGVVSLAERFAGAEPRRAFEDMVGHVAGLLVPFDEAHGIAAVVASGGAQMLGTSGTVTTMAGIHLDLCRYDRSRIDGIEIGFPALESVGERLLDMDRRTRLDHPCIGPDRADFVVAGSAILAAICRLWPIGRLRVADRGLREGILLRLMRAAA